MHKENKDQMYYKIGQVMKLLNVSRRKVEYCIEILRLEPEYWQSGVRLFSSKQVEMIKERLQQGRCVKNNES